MLLIILLNFEATQTIIVIIGVELSYSGLLIFSGSSSMMS